MKHFSLFTLGIYLFDMTYIDSAYPASDSIIETEQRTNQMNNLLRIISDLQVSCNYGQFLSTKYNYCWCNVIIYCMWISWKYLMLFSKHHLLQAWFYTIQLNLIGTCIHPTDHFVTLPHVQKYLMSVRYIEELQKFVEDDNYK